MRKPILPALVLLAAAGAVTLTGCSAATAPAASPSASVTRSAPAPSPSASAAAEGQSLQEACAIANEAALGLQADVNAALADPTNQEAVSSALDSVTAGLAAALEEISQPEVEAAVGDLQGRFASFGEMLATLQAGQPTQEQVAALQTAATDLQASADTVRELCT